LQLALGASAASSQSKLGASLLLHHPPYRGICVLHCLRRSQPAALQSCKARTGPLIRGRAAPGLSPRRRAVSLCARQPKPDALPFSGLTLLLSRRADFSRPPAPRARRARPPAAPPPRSTPARRKNRRFAAHGCDLAARAATPPSPAFLAPRVSPKPAVVQRARLQQPRCPPLQPAARPVLQPTRWPRSACPSAAPRRASRAVPAMLLASAPLAAAPLSPATPRRHLRAGGSPRLWQTQPARDAPPGRAALLCVRRSPPSKLARRQLPRYPRPPLGPRAVPALRPAPPTAAPQVLSPRRPSSSPAPAGKPKQALRRSR
jgi:hypothetical protein